MVPKLEYCCSSEGRASGLRSIFKASGQISRFGARMARTDGRVDVGGGVCRVTKRGVPFAFKGFGPGPQSG